jgi:antibiotic biosynthesis monooxygenase (ABM) superfamily enzyme
MFIWTILYHVFVIFSTYCGLLTQDPIDGTTNVVYGIKLSCVASLHFNLCVCARVGSAWLYPQIVKTGIKKIKETLDVSGPFR